MSLSVVDKVSKLAQRGIRLAKRPDRKEAASRAAGRRLSKVAVGLLKYSAELEKAGPESSKPSTPLASMSEVEIVADNLRFSEELIAKARGDSSLPTGETTYVEDVMKFFFGGYDRHPASPSRMFQNYVNYALRSRTRGKKLADAYIQEPASLKSYLDVGCAYGGAPIELAARGVQRCVGIEYDDRLLVLAEKQAKEAELSHRVSFHEGDLTDTESMKQYGKFDFITCIDVLEHVLDPKAAIRSLAELCSEGGQVVVDVPNPYSYQQITKDPHHHIFGSILLSRPDAIKVYKDEFEGANRYTVGYFHGLEWYLEELSKYGFEVELMDSIQRFNVTKVQAALEELSVQYLILREEKQWKPWRRKLVGDALDKFFAELSQDRGMADSSPEQFLRKYAVPVHHLKCTKVSSN